MSQSRAVLNTNTLLPAMSSGFPGIRRCGIYNDNLGLVFRTFSRTMSTLAASAVSILFMTTMSAIRGVLTGVVHNLMAGPVRVTSTIWQSLVEGDIVAAAIPEDHIYLFFRLFRSRRKSTLAYTITRGRWGSYSSRLRWCTIGQVVACSEPR